MTQRMCLAADVDKSSNGCVLPSIEECGKFKVSERFSEVIGRYFNDGQRRLKNRSIVVIFPFFRDGSTARTHALNLLFQLSYAEGDISGSSETKKNAWSTFLSGLQPHNMSYRERITRQTYLTALLALREGDFGGVCNIVKNLREQTVSEDFRALVSQIEVASKAHAGEIELQKEQLINVTSLEAYLRHLEFQGKYNEVVSFVDKERGSERRVVCNTTLLVHKASACIFLCKWEEYQRTDRDTWDGIERHLLLRSKAKHMMNRGRVFQNEGECAKAIVLFKSTQEICEATGDQFVKAYSSYFLRRVFLRVGNLEAAIDGLSTTDYAHPSIRSRQAIVKCERWIILRLVKEAEEKLLVVNAKCRDWGDPEGEALTCSLLGKLYLSKSKARKALEQYEKQMEIAEHLGHCFLGVEARIGRSECLRASGLYDEALEELNIAIEDAREANYLSGWWDGQRAKARSMVEFGMYADAIKIIDILESFDKRNEDYQHYIEDLILKGKAHDELENPGKAIEAYNKAHGFYHQLKGLGVRCKMETDLDIQEALVQAKLGKHEEGIKKLIFLASTEPRYSSPPDVRAIRVQIGKLLKGKGDLSEARSLLKDSINEAKGLEAHLEDAFYELGQVHLQESHPELAQESLRECMRVVEERCANLEDDGIRILLLEKYARASFALEEVVRDTEKFQIANFRMSNIFLEEVGRRRKEWVNDIPYGPKEYKALAKKLDTVFLVYSLAPYRNGTPDARAWMVHPERGVSPGESISLAWIKDYTQNPDMLFKEYPYDEERCRLVEAGRDDEALRKFDRMLKKAYKSLVKPFLPHITIGKRVTVIGEGWIGALPFSLFTRKKKFLFIRNPISHAPSMGFLQVMGENPPGNKDERAFVATSLSKESEHSKSLEEACLVSTLLGVDVQNDFSYSELQEKARKARFLYLCCHGRPSKTSSVTAYKGALKLKKKRYIYADELTDLNVESDHIFLSVCSPKQGRVTGQGIIGIVRGLQVAGARSIISSLWSIPSTERKKSFVVGVIYRMAINTLSASQAVRGSLMATWASLGGDKMHTDDRRRIAFYDVAGFCHCGL